MIKVENKPDVPFIGAMFSTRGAQLGNQYKIFILVDQILRTEEGKDRPRKSRQQLKVAKQLLKESGNIKVKVNPPNTIEMQKFIEEMVGVAERAASRQESLSQGMKEKVIELKKCIEHLRAIHSRQTELQPVNYLDAFREFTRTSSEFIRYFLQEKINTLLAQTSCGSLRPD